MVEDLVEKFEDLIAKYHISEIIDTDPSIGAIPVIWLDNLDYFSIECMELLYSNIRKQKKKIYIKINNFKDEIKRYLDYLGRHFDFTGGNLMYLIQRLGFDMDSLKKQMNIN